MEDSMLFKFFLAQLKDTKQGDWASQVLKDLQELDIQIELEQIQQMSYDKYSQLLTENIDKLAYNWLMNKKRSTSENARGKNLKCSESKMADYLCPFDQNISIDEQKCLFKSRVEDIDVKANIGGK